MEATAATIRSEPAGGAIELASPAVLQMQGISKTFGAVNALSDVSLQLGRGEIRAICGENGAGKSTLVKTLTGIHRPDAGTIMLDGVAEDFHDPRQAQACGVNLVSQELSICGGLTVLDNLWLGSLDLPFFHKKAALRQKAEGTLARIGATHIDLDRLAATLSTGERQLLEIARMINRDTRVLILDEPTATLSDREIVAIMNAIRALKATGCAVLYITHRLAEVFDVCDTATVMRDGTVVSDGPVADLDRDRLIELMLGRPLDTLFPERGIEVGDAVLTVKDLQVPATTGTLSFSVPKGQIVCLTGQLGSGAEPVIRAVCGLESTARGTIEVDGVAVPQGRPEAARAAGIRFVSGDRAEEGIFIDQPVWSNLVATRLERRGVFGFLRPGRLKAEAADLGARVTVDATRQRARAGDLSGGNQQKLAFGRCLDDADGRVIVMIEPTRGIDVGARADIYALMRDFCRQGYGILVASTDFTEVLGLGDRVITMYRGALVNTYRADGVSLPQIIADVTHPEGDRA